MKYTILICLQLFFINLYGQTFNPSKDIIALHYDNAPDLDDGQSASADRTLLQTKYGIHWLKKHLIIVNGTYGTNANTFHENSEKVMNVVWGHRWLSAHKDWNTTVIKAANKWFKTIIKGGKVWIKEGGQSDFTSDVVKYIKAHHPDINTRKDILLVQHSKWNEDKTTPEKLDYVKINTHYIKISDANAYSVIQHNSPDIKHFVDAALGNPVYKKYWTASFKYYAPLNSKTGKIDYSDTGELMYILGLGKLSVEEFKNTYLLNK